MKKNNSKPRKGNYSGKPRKSKEVYDNKEMPNNPNWYAKNPQLLKDTASIPFSNVLGKRLPINSDGIASASVPGIMCIDYAHSLGGGQSATDAPTVAARYIYSYVRHANSGSANYEAPDLYMMIVAWHSANAFIEHAKRAYGTMMHYLARNRFFAETVVRAMGFDYASLMRSLPAFRSAINQASAKLNSIKVPGDMPLGDRWKQLASEYYCDGQSSKAQLYIPNCIEFLKYDGYGSATGTSLVRFEPMPFMDVETWRLAVEQLLAPLLAEEDVGIMSGDIQKAFGDNVSRVSMIDESYYALPIFSNEMLAQIHNLIMPGVHAATPVGHARVYQNAGVIIDDFFIHENNLTMTNHILTSLSLELLLY
uniref:Capsid protein n=1 Tax=Dromedary picobirnavirus TaxID=1574421 RepID=A0A0A1EKX9_9VIRU|nr:capsid protein [Dromedary picobirnavirus]